MPRLPRAMMVLTSGIAGGLVVVAIVALAVGGVGSTFGRVRAVVEPSLPSGWHSSPIARWWRCRGVDRPSLVELGSEREPGEWRLEYSWAGSFGRGNVNLTVTSGGAGSFEFHELGRSEPEVVVAEVPPAALQRIASAIDESSFLCLSPMDRRDHRVMDLGRYSVTVVTGGYAKTIYVDTCRYVPDAEAFANVLSAVYDLEGIFGERLTWGPRGYATVDGPCDSTGKARPDARQR